MDGSISSARELPRSLPGWLPFLWSRVLFPGVPNSDVLRSCSRSWLILVVVPAALLYPCLSFHLFEPDESRYAEIPREMLQRGEAVVPYLQGEPYLDKPPLLYWCVELGYALVGTRIWVARLAPALAVHLCVLITYFLGRRTLGERPAFWGALALSLAPGFMCMGRLLLLDGLLTLWTTLSLLAGFEGVRDERLRWSWWLVAGVACGLGVLTKGPIAVVLVVPPLVMYRWLSNSGCRIRLAYWAAFAGVLLGITLPWYLAMCGRVPAFAREFFWEHNIRRFLAPFAHQHGVWFYAPVLLGGLFPGTLLLVPLVRFLLASDADTLRLRTPQLGFQLLAGGWCVFFFTLSACKLPTYILPAFPPLCLALGYFLVHTRRAPSRGTVALLTTTFLVLLSAHYLVLPWYSQYRSPVRCPEPLERLCADRSVAVVCYPRNCDSVSFLLGRDDLQSFRSKDIEDLRHLVRENPRTVILCTHRHSLRGLKQLLPPEVGVVDEIHLGLEDIPGVPRAIMKPLALLMGETALGLCDLAVVEHSPPGATLAKQYQSRFDAATIEQAEDGTDDDDDPLGAKP
jgi:4-amino-4-deoxy-L-arabinose transferase-like glycosyltransferase